MQHTLLHVEDNPQNQKLVEQIIARRSDLNLLTAADAKNGLELARTYRPGVILMDINLPDMSGFKALEVLRSEPATAHTPVIALSANAMPLNVESGLAAGFFRYLTKPLDLGEFMDALDAALQIADKRSLRT
jgi:CheY-like chemotaxis protein